MTLDLIIPFWFLWLYIFQGFTVYTFLVKVIYRKDKFSKMSRHI